MPDHRLIQKCVYFVQGRFGIDLSVSKIFLRVLLPIEVNLGILDARQKAAADGLRRMQQWRLGYRRPGLSIKCSVIARIFCMSLGVSVPRTPRPQIFSKAWATHEATAALVLMVLSGGHSKRFNPKGYSQSSTDRYTTSFRRCSGMPAIIVWVKSPCGSISPIPRPRCISARMRLVSSVVLPGRWRR